MFEAKLSESSVFKKIFEIVKDVVNDSNISCEEDGIRMQSMDSTHSALLCMHLKPKFFRRFRCDRAVTLGLSIPSFFKILKVAKDDDKLTVTAVDDDPDAVEIKFEARKSSRISSYSLNLLTIDGEELNIPDQEYHAKIVMPSSELSAIVKDLLAVDDTVVVHVNKTGLRLEAAGHQAKGEVWVKSDVPVKPVKDDDDWNDDGEGDRTLVKEEDEDEDDDIDKPVIKKRKLQESTNTIPSSSPIPKKSKEKIKRSHSETNEISGPDPQTIIQVTSNISGLTYKLKYLQAITKCASLADKVELLIGPDSPLLVQYDVGTHGHIRYYLAPQIGDDS
ncbi:proliferating cell nuclear antigen [Marasmius sp. AFHP31]|nr:proliferating cell nuclear antigen [Marasmius sp. AFHP31]